MSKQNTDLGRTYDYITKKLKSDIDNEYELLQEFISNRLDINTYDKLGDTILTNAIKHKDMELIRVLINAGAKVNKQGIWTYTGLMYTVENGGEHAVAIMCALIEAKADVNMQDSEGKTALMKAAAKGRVHTQKK